jgi:hypothetical protein
VRLRFHRRSRERDGDARGVTPNMSNELHGIAPTRPIVLKGFGILLPRRSACYSASLIALPLLGQALGYATFA